MADHFFSEAPIVPWSTTAYRKLVGKSETPKLLNTTLATLPHNLPPSPTGRPPSRMVPEKAGEYSQFLKSNYAPRHVGQLSIPDSLFRIMLPSNFWVGAELRDTSQALAGIVICQYAGLEPITQKPMGLISWLCVAPAWRKKGITNLLLRAVYCYAQPIQIFWWRNDNWNTAPTSPLYSEVRMFRKGGSLPSKFRCTKKIQETVFSDWWKEKNPGGLVFSDPTVSNPLYEVYKYSYTASDHVYLLLQPTFEKQAETDEAWCEVLAWATVGSLSEKQLQSAIETILQTVPYKYIDAPTSMPNSGLLWKPLGATYWCVMGIDYGTANQRPILPLVSA